MVEVGPAADEAVLRVRIDATHVIRAITVVPTAPAGQGQREGGISGGAEGRDGKSRGISAVLAAGGLGNEEGGDEGDDEGDDEGGGGVPDRSEEADVEAYVIYPAKHHVVADGEMDGVLSSITAEMEERCAHLGSEGRWLEAERLRQRTDNDLLLLRTVGTCKVTGDFLPSRTGSSDADKVSLKRVGNQTQRQVRDSGRCTCNIVQQPPSQSR